MRIGKEPRVVFDIQLDRMSFDEAVDFLDLNRANMYNSWIFKRGYPWSYETTLDAYTGTLYYCYECCDYFDDPDDMDEESYKEGRLCRVCSPRSSTDDKIDEIRGK